MCECVCVCVCVRGVRYISSAIILIQFDNIEYFAKPQLTPT